MSEAQLTLLERFGRYWEAQGGSRIAGKIVGWMMVCDPAHQSMADIAAVLGVSHGSVSTQTRQLETLGYLERITFPGDRTSYFVLNHDGWAGIMEAAWTAPVVELNELARQARELTASGSDRSTDLVLMTEFLLSEWPGFVAQMRTYIAQHSPGTPSKK